jgi:hypothetical protein
MTFATCRPVAERLEDRILHSADVAPLLLGAHTATWQQPLSSATPGDVSVQHSEIVFVDAGLPDAAGLLADLQAQVGQGRPLEVVQIGAGQDGLSLIGQTLAGRHDIAAVHVLAHGADGVLFLGSSQLDEASLLQRAGEVAAWGDALTPDADLLLYGCDVAQTARGQQFVQHLAALTGADVAASTDLTGAAAQGGNWRLEYQVGHLQTVLAPSAWEQTRWQGVLDTYTVTTTVDMVGANLLTGSLRWAISQANAHAGADTIVFAVNGQFNMQQLTSGDNSNNSGDFDITDSLTLVGNGSTQTVINGNGLDRVFDLRSGNITLSNLTVRGGASNSGAGILVAVGTTATLDGVVIENNLGVGSSKGGGVYSNGNLVLRNTVIRNNGDASANALTGAGLYINNGSLLAQDVEISGNIANGRDGGGLYISGGDAVVLNRVTLAGNTADRGGGLWNSRDNVTLSNVTVSGNTATSQGGGLWSDHQLSLDHVTVAFNNGGGVYDKEGEVSSASSLFVANSGGNVNQALISQGYNLSDDNSAGFTGTGDRKNVAVSLGALANNGGFTRTHAISVGSAARDSADPADTLGGDQRGVAYLGRADIGAYEYNPYGQAPTITGPADQLINEDTALNGLVFTVGDDQTAPGSLVVTASSSNAALINNASIVIAGTGANRTISFTPVANANSDNAGGPVTITLSVSDGGSVTTTTFLVTVAAVNDAPTLSLPAPQTLAEDSSLTLSGAQAPHINDLDAGTASVQVTLVVAHGLLTLSQTTGLAFITGTGSGNSSPSMPRWTDCAMSLWPTTTAPISCRSPSMTWATVAAAGPRPRQGAWT